MLATKKDFLLVALIGLLVGVLAQPIISNNLDSFQNIISMSDWGIRILILVFFVILAPIALAIASFLGSRIPSIFQFAKFAAVGSLNSFVDLGIFNLLGYLFVPQIKDISKVLFVTFKSISFFVATLNSYLWNKNWTFGDRAKTHAETLLKFYVITGINYFLNTGVAFLAKEWGPQNNIWVSFVAPVCGILAAMFSNFFAYKFLVFKEEEKLVTA